MASGIFYPVVSGDDGDWKSTFFQSHYNDLLLGNGLGPLYNDFFRFPNVVIPNGATIGSAFVRISASQSSSSTIVNLRVYGNDADDAVAPTSVTEGNALVLTTAFADWNNLPAWTFQVQYDTPDITSVIQEIVDRVGWSSGNAMLMLIKDNGGSNYRKAYQVDYISGIQKAELHVGWTGGPAGWTGKVSGVSSPGKVLGISSANIAKILGV